MISTVGCRGLPKRKNKVASRRGKKEALLNLSILWGLAKLPS